MGLDPTADACIINQIPNKIYLNLYTRTERILFINNLIIYMHRIVQQ